MRKVIKAITAEMIVATRNSQDLWIGVSRDLLIASCFVGSFKEFALLEHRAGTDQCDQVRRVHGSPAGLRGLDELERHRDPGGSGTGSPRDPAPKPDGGEGRLDRVGGTQVDPVLGGEVVEREQHVEVLGDLGDRPGPLGSVAVSYTHLTLPTNREV